MTKTCSYCKREFKTDQYVLLHQKTAKYCLKIQGEREIKYFCSFCNKSCTTKQNFENHQKSCKNLQTTQISESQKSIYELQNIIKDKDILIMKLQTQLEIYKKDREVLNQIAKQPRNTNNKVLILSPFIMTQNQINSIVEDKFTAEDFLNGQRGVAKFATNNILKDDEGNQTYICTDASRNVFSYKDKDGNIEKDIKAEKLTETISPAVIKKSEKIYEQIRSCNTIYNSDIAQSYLDIRNLQHEPERFVSELSKLTINNSSSSLVLHNFDHEEEIDGNIEYIIETESEDKNMKQQKQREMIDKYKNHENQKLYQYHVKKYEQLFGPLN